jgi:hypothetical protein
MNISLIKHVLLGAAVGAGCLVIAYGFHAAGHAGVREALFIRGIYYDGTNECVHCSRMKPELAGDKTGTPLQ